MANGEIRTTILDANVCISKTSIASKTSKYLLNTITFAQHIFHLFISALFYEDRRAPQSQQIFNKRWAGDIIINTQNAVLFDKVILYKQNYKTEQRAKFLPEEMVAIHTWSKEEIDAMFTFGSLRPRPDRRPDRSQEDAFIKMYKNSCVAQLV